MSSEVRVRAEHLDALAARHAEVAEALGAAIAAADGPDTRMRATHGDIAASTGDATAATFAARAAAGERLTRIGRDLEHGLRASAARYRSADDELGGGLDRQLRPA